MEVCGGNLNDFYFIGHTSLLKNILKKTLIFLLWKNVTVKKQKKEGRKEGG